MTNEQAIKWLKNYIQNTPFQMEQYERAFEMAIQALSQEPCDDVISRKAVCDYIAEFVNNEYSTQAECEMVDLMIEGIQHLPSVTQKYGKWIRVTDKTGHLVWECDKCGWQQRFNTNFCPDCGAKMESEE